MSFTIQQALAKAEELKGVSDIPRLDVEVLLAHALKCNKTHLYAWPEKVLDTNELAEFEQLFARRINGEPVAYLVGYKEFWSLQFQVNPSTLIPRPDTELLVEKTLTLIPETSAYQIVDLGTGTGAIALAIASERSRSHVVGCDVEPQAVELAKTNKALLAITNVDFIRSDWCAELTDPVDIIVSNPPYIEPEDPHLKQGDIRYEPHSALVSDNKGLSDIKHISKAAAGLLKQNGWLLLEHGYNQGDNVRSILSAAGFHNVATDSDLAGHDRITYGQKLS